MTRQESINKAETDAIDCSSNERNPTWLYLMDVCPWFIWEGDNDD